VPFIASFHPKTNFYRYWKFFLLPCIIVAAFFIAWDALFTHIGVWGFNPKYLTGVYLYNLPLEEILFFIAIPYACVFTYFCVRKFISIPHASRFVKAIQITLVAGLLTSAVLNIQRYYTATTFILLSSLLLLQYRNNMRYMAHFLLSFLIILLPFLMSNGILTGAFTDEPVVIYNDAHNLGVRIGTIPVEDTFYAMLIMLMNVAGFEYMIRKEHPGEAHTISLSKL
jgi:lycopene cyclase domain-containing protein